MVIWVDQKSISFLICDIFPEFKIAQEIVSTAVSSSIADKIRSFSIDGLELNSAEFILAAIDLIGSKTISEAAFWALTRSLRAFTCFWDDEELMNSLADRFKDSSEFSTLLEIEISSDFSKSFSDSNCSKRSYKARTNFCN